MDIQSLINKNILKIIVRPNAPTTKVKEYDKERQALKVDIAAPPDKDKANKEVIKFFSKLLKKKVSIKSGSKSREKLLEIR